MGHQLSKDVTWEVFLAMAPALGRDNPRNGGILNLIKTYGSNGDRPILVILLGCPHLIPITPEHSLPVQDNYIPDQPPDQDVHAPFPSQPRSLPIRFGYQ